jgi:hypothetical protein
MKKLGFLLLAFVLTVFASCTKVEDSCCGPDVSGQSDLATRPPVAMYSLENTYKMKPDRCEVDESSILVKDEILSNNDILSYSEKEMYFTVTPEGYKKIQKLQDAQPFVLTVAFDVMLVGMFKPFISQSVCEHSVLMNFKENNKVYFFTGNPTELTNADVTSKVNNKFLINALKDSGRLK